MADRNSQLPTGSLKQKLIRRFIAAYERQNPGTTVKIAEPRMHLPGGPDPFTYAWEVIAVRPDSTILTALVAAVRPTGKKRTKFVDFTGRSEKRRVGKECVSKCRSRGWP